MLKKITLSILTASSIHAMHTAEINVNEYDLEAKVKFDLGQFNTTVEPDTTFLGVSFLKGSPENDSIDANNDVDNYLDLNFMVKQNIQDSGFKVGLGIKAVYTSAGSNDYISLPIGAELSYILPIQSAIPIGFTASASYAPQSLSFQDAKNYLDYRIEAYAELMDRASVYAGYRNIDTNYDTNGADDYTYNKSAYFGIKFSF